MKKVFLGIFLALILFITTSNTNTYAAGVQIKVDGVPVLSDVESEIKYNRTMVPLRVISENLGAKVEWFDHNITITKGDMKVVLKPNSKVALKNGKTELLDVSPYIKNNRTMVPLRFLSKTFGCKVEYKNSTVTIDTEPLFINGVKVNVLQREYRMTMGGVVEQFQGNVYNTAFYDIFVKNKGEKVNPPTRYAWHIHSVEPGDYYKNGQFDFLDKEGKSIKRFDIYSLVQPYQEETSSELPEVLMYDANENQWYLFNKDASESILQLIESASKNGFRTIISDTVA
ncbi:copper amine oxidase N-terminal domain-containing protein [Bacillus sp. AK128]